MLVGLGHYIYYLHFPEKCFKRLKFSQMAWLAAAIKKKKFMDVFWGYVNNKCDA